jgi:hypothetical protein
VFRYGENEFLMANIALSSYGDYHASMANIPKLMAIIKCPMANIEAAMAKIETSMANITSRYGDNSQDMAEIVLIWRKLSQASRTGMAGIALKSEAG